MSERRTSNMVTFDMMPCQNATLDDINTRIIVNEYLPKAIDGDVLEQDKRELKEQMASLRLFDLRLDCPTYAGIILFGKTRSISFPATTYSLFVLREKRGLFLFYLPPYSPELNPAETVWRILKGKWIRPMDYETTDSLFYCTNRALAAVGKNLLVNYSYL